MLKYLSTSLDSIVNMIGVWGAYNHLFCLHLRFDNKKIIQISSTNEEYGYSLDLDLLIILYW